MNDLPSPSAIIATDLLTYTAGVCAKVRAHLAINRPLPTKIARRKRRGKGNHHCGPFKPDFPDPEPRHTTGVPKAPENALSGDSATQCGQSVTPETEQQP